MEENFVLLQFRSQTDNLHITYCSTLWHQLRGHPSTYTIKRETFDPLPLVRVLREEWRHEKTDVHVWSDLLLPLNCAETKWMYRLVNSLLITQV